MDVSVQEGILNAVGEGMACGLPIVVRQVSDLPLIVEAGDNGITCNAFDPMDIARTLKAMIADAVVRSHGHGLLLSKTVE